MWERARQKKKKKKEYGCILGMHKDHKATIQMSVLIGEPVILERRQIF